MSLSTKQVVTHVSKCFLIAFMKEQKISSKSIDQKDQAV